MADVTRQGAALTAEVVEDPAELGPAREEWRELTVATANPFSGPAWAMSWWEHLRPTRAKLRLVLVRDGERLAGVMPLWSQGSSYRTLGGGIAPIEPLALPGIEAEVASAFASALAELTPAPASIEIERHASSPRWAELLEEAWPGGRGGWIWERLSEAVPYTELPDGFDSWFEAKSSSFRREMRRKRKRMAGAGAGFRDATPESLAADVDAFLRLHRARMEEKGGTSLGSPGVGPMLESIGAELLEGGRFRLLMIDLGGEPIAAQLVVSAGTEVCAWNTGFDAAHAKLSPLMLCMLRVIEDSAGGERRVNLGPGAQDYKYRLCEEEDRLLREVLVPRGRSYPLGRLRLLPARLMAAARRARSTVRGFIRFPGERAQSAPRDTADPERRCARGRPKPRPARGRHPHAARFAELLGRDDPVGH